MKQTYWASLACISIACSHAVIAAGPDAADATAVTPSMIYRSPFADYRALGEDKSIAWKDANETVGKVGGWRAYAREAAEAMKARATAETMKSAPAATAPSMPAPTPPASMPHAHKHGG